MKLIIAEKPSLGKAVAAHVGATRRGDGCLRGDDVAVTWAFGHLFEQAPPDAYDEKYKRWNAADLPIVPTDWKLNAKEDAKKQLKIIGALIKEASEIIHLGDPDREGQLLIDEILTHFKCKLPVKRLWLAALDDASIKKALSSMKPGAEYANLCAAAEARSRADWLVGMNLTRGWTVHGRQFNRGVLSVGRVQTPTLAMIVRRDLLIEGFKARDFYEVIGSFPFAAKWKPSDSVQLDEEGRLLDLSVAESIAAKVTGKPGRVVKADSKDCRQAPPLPFSLSKLQQKASAKFGMSAQDVLDVAQSLYETHKVTSYPRTDCQYLPESMHAGAADILAKLGIEGDSNLKSGAFNDKKITAHHAIIPTGVKPSGLNDYERKIYDLICLHYQAQFWPDHEYRQVQIQIEVEGEQFATSGKTVIKPGWKSLFAAEKDESDDEEDQEAVQSLPELATGDDLVCSEARVAKKRTTPPKRYTDGLLIADMTNIQKYVNDPELRAKLKETAGIGTEATRANIIETLVRRKFVEKKGKNLISTEAGRALIAALGDSNVTDAGMTARFEQQLDEIAAGRLSPDVFLAEVVADIRGQLLSLTGVKMAMGTEQPRAASAGKSSAPAVKGKKCPKCGSAMVKRKSANGEFLGCSTFPVCRGTAQV